MHWPRIFPADIDECSRPSDPCCKVRFEIYTSFELGPMLGHEDLLRTFEISVTELFDRSENSRRQ
jgi:hypothetical protein